MHIIRKSVFDIKHVESGNGGGGGKKCGKWKMGGGGQKMWKVEIGGSKIVESGNWGVLITPTNDVFYYIIHSFMIS